MALPNDVNDMGLLSDYAERHGFSEEYNTLVKMHERSGYDLLDLLVQAQKMHQQYAKDKELNEQSIDTIVKQDALTKENAIDAIVDKDNSSALRCAYETGKHIVKVAAKGTWYALKNLRLHYPFVGALPGHIQEKIAKNLMKAKSATV